MDLFALVRSFASLWSEKGKGISYNIVYQIIIFVIPYCDLDTLKTLHLTDRAISAQVFKRLRYLQAVHFLQRRFLHRVAQSCPDIFNIGPGVSRSTVRLLCLTHHSWLLTWNGTHRVEFGEVLDRLCGPKYRELYLDLNQCRCCHRHQNYHLVFDNKHKGTCGCQCRHLRRYIECNYEP
jgi:hypothetical protein